MFSANVDALSTGSSVFLIYSELFPFFLKVSVSYQIANSFHFKILECEGNSGEFVELVPEHLNYLGPKDLTQYFIRSKVDP